MFRELGDRQGEAKALCNIGIELAETGERERALEFYKQHLEISRELGDRLGEADALWNMSATYGFLGDFAGAVARGEEALEIFKRLKNPFVIEAREQLTFWRELAGQHGGQGKKKKKKGWRFWK